MSWDNCIVIMNSDSIGNFYTGDMVTGSVILDFKKDQKIEYIILKVIGRTKARWNRPQPTMPYIKIYTEQRDFFNIDIELLKELKGKQVRAGIQNLHFHFTLPSDLPSSFKSSIARISYFIKIEGKSPFKFKRVKKTEIMVRTSIDLNYDELYLIPVHYTFSKTAWNQKTVSLNLKTYRACAPNQYVPFKCFITNEKKVALSKMVVTLVQKLRYIVPSGYADEEKDKCRVQYKNFSNTVVETCSFGMDIPQTNPSTTNVREPITVHISYVFRIQLDFSFHSKLIEEVPLTVSTVPVIHFDFDENVN